VETHHHNQNTDHMRDQEGQEERVMKECGKPLGCQMSSACKILTFTSNRMYVVIFFLFKLGLVSKFGKILVSSLTFWIIKKGCLWAGGDG
jgi:hypothetical protein